MGLNSKKILGIPITISPKEHILEEIRKYLQKIKNQRSKIKSEEIKPLVIFTPNPEIITYAQKDLTFKQIVASSQINIPDGAGICWAVRKKYDFQLARLSGVDFMQDLSLFASKESFRIGIIGGRGGVAVDSLKCLKRQYPGLSGWAMDGPEIEISNIKDQRSKISIRQAQDPEYIEGHIKNQKEKYFSSLVNEIKKRRIDILFVALGFPKQEYFIRNIKDQISKIKNKRPLVMMSVGGALDYISGRIPRAPLFLRSIGLEWLFRLVAEPWRWRRQLEGAEFFIKVLLAK